MVYWNAPLFIKLISQRIIKFFFFFSVKHRCLELFSNAVLHMVQLQVVISKNSSNNIANSTGLFFFFNNVTSMLLLSSQQFSPLESGQTLWQSWPIECGWIDVMRHLRLNDTIKMSRILTWLFWNTRFGNPAAILWGSPNQPTLYFKVLSKFLYIQPMSHLYLSYEFFVVMWM